MKFAEVLEIKNGKNQKQVEDADGKYPIYGSGGIMGWATDYICPAKTVIIGRKGTINNPIYVDSPFWNVDTAFGLVADKSILHPKYLYYFCKHFDFLALNTTVTIPSLTKANLLKIDIPVPDMDEQQYVVRVLDDVENLIEIKTKEKFELDNLVKSRFIEMFGDYKINDKGFDCKKGSELFKFSSGKFLPEEKRLETGVPVYGGNGIAWYTEESLIDYPTVIIGRVGAQCGNIHSVTTPVWITDNAIYIKEQKTMAYTLEFLSELMRMMNFYQYADFSGQPKITQKPLETLDYIMPPVELQREYTAFVEQTDKLKFDGIKIINLFEILKIKSWRRES